MRRSGRWRPGWLAVALAVAVPACGGDGTAAPRCRPDQRLGIVAQSVPGAAYLPCVDDLAPGWSVVSFAVEDGSARIRLRSDRSDRDVQVELVGACDVGGAVPVAPRDPGVRTYQDTESVSPRYAARLYDVFAEGCVVYDLDFPRGRHIALVDELQQAVQLYPRRQLRQELQDDLGITLDP